MFATLYEIEKNLAAMAAEFEPACVSGSLATRLVSQLAKIRCLTDAVLAAAAARVDETYAYRATGAKDAATFVANATGATTFEAQRSIKVARTLERHPLTKAAVVQGALSTAQAELIAATAAKNPGAEASLIATAARGMTQLKDECLAARNAVEDESARRQRQHSARSFRTWTDRHTGMLNGAFALAPEVGAHVKAIVDTFAQSLFRSATPGDRETSEHYAADAFVSLVVPSRESNEADSAGQHPPAATRRAGSVKASVHVVIDHQALLRGNALPGERCEIPGVGPVNVQWVREQLGSAFVTAIIGKGKDIRTVAHLGRYINAELRTALIASGRECDIEGCCVRGYLEVDHSEIDHAQRGPTAWWNLGWLCYQHHRFKSSGASLGPRDRATGERMFKPAIVSDA